VRNILILRNVLPKSKVKSFSREFKMPLKFLITEFLEDIRDLMELLWKRKRLQLEFSVLWGFVAMIRLLWYQNPNCSGARAATPRST